MLYYRKDTYHAWQPVDVKAHRLYSIKDMKAFVAMFPSIEFCMKRV